MSRKRTEPLRITATEARRRLSAILDRIEAGESFVVQRRGRDVCVLGPVPVVRRRISECLDLLRDRPPVLLDDRFGSDLLDIISSEVTEDRSPWDE